ncbi:hypothetical protein VTK26DRAFT_4745 [Humicola hyalothermophila]
MEYKYQVTSKERYKGASSQIASNNSDSRQTSRLSLAFAPNFTHFSLRTAGRPFIPNRDLYPSFISTSHRHHAAVSCYSCSRPRHRRLCDAPRPYAKCTPKWEPACPQRQLLCAKHESETRRLHRGQWSGWPLRPWRQQLYAFHWILSLLKLMCGVWANNIGLAGGGALSCVAQSRLTCDNNVIERGKSLCRANAPGGGLFDGANIIPSLDQATVN